MLDSIKSLVKTTQPFDSSSEQFNQLDLAEVAKGLNLKSRAAELGSRNIPSRNEKNKDELATTIDFFFSQLVLTTKNQIASLFEAGNRSFEQKIGEQNTDVAIRMDTNECEGELKKTARTLLQRVYLKKRDLHWFDIGYEDFRSNNKLVAPADYPTGEARSKIYGIIVLIFGLELILNSSILGGAHPGGFIGVAAEVFAFAVINIFLAFFLGNFTAREWNHIFLARKVLLGAVASMILVSIIVLFNLFFAHYRDALATAASSDFSFETQYSQMGGAAFSSFLSTPFELNDFKSYLLWVLGCCLAFFAAFEFYKTDDSYPGYGKIHRSRDRFAEDFIRECDTYQEETSEVVNRYYDDYRDKAKMIRAQKESARDWVNRHNAIIDKYQGWLNHLNIAGASLYKIYRTENQLNRNDEGDLPTSFEIEFEIDNKELLSQSFVKLSGDDYNFENKDHEKAYEDQASRFKLMLGLHHDLLKDIANLGREDSSLNDADGHQSAEEKVSELLSKIESSLKG